ncbi:hypothetical protein [Actinoplanes sp. NPDC051411]|uniref:hypothetical protein n=1 Tax=Actinoplanes sp. NPDC051411 TaxID=3155522 RepID=UPI00343F3179
MEIAGVPGHRDESANRVFLIAGSESRGRDALRGFLQALGLVLVGPDQIADRKGRGPRGQDVLREGFAAADAVVVVVTPSDGPDLLADAGLALAMHPDRTVLVETGSTSRLSGRFDSETRAHRRQDHPPTGPARRAAAAGRPGCGTDGSDWLYLGRFDAQAEFDQQYREVRREDAQIVADFFAAAMARHSLGRVIDVGSGANLCPALIMLPYSSETTLCERSLSSRQWLTECLQAPQAS